jgi:hypothetical protein
MMVGGDRAFDRHDEGGGGAFGCGMGTARRVMAADGATRDFAVVAMKVVGGGLARPCENSPSECARRYFISDEGLCAGHRRYAQGFLLSARIKFYVPRRRLGFHTVCCARHD